MIEHDLPTRTRRKTLKYDLTGMRFGYLEVISRNPSYKDRKVWWNCKCDCGKAEVVRTRSLTSGDKKSCRCKMYLPAGESAFNRIYSDYRWSAKDRGLEFNLTEEQARELLTKNCFYCGAPPSSYRTGKTLKTGFLYNGIDRVDNQLGYIDGNCVSCCKVCNHAKAKLSKSDFLGWVLAVYNHSLANSTET